MASVITLSSSNTTTEQNSPARFTTRFPSPLCFDSGWEVALLDISYPKTWWTVPTEAYYLTYKDRKIILPPGFYQDAQRIVDYFQTEIKKHTVQGPKLRYLTSNNRIEVTRKESLHFSPDLAGVFGIDPDQDPSDPFCGKWEVDLDSAFHHLYVYTDCITEGLVGDTSAPLLRTVEVRSSDQYGDRVYLSYPHPFYRPLQRRSIDILEIFIADELGRPVLFRGRDNVLVTLHFRPHG